jgi:transposase-like protein
MVEDYPRTIMELEKRFCDDAACRSYLFALRWAEGFVCPHCQANEVWSMTNGRWLCAGCRAQVSVMAGTIFQDSKLPLTIWFRAMWQLTSQKNGVSALGLQRVLGLGSYKTAWAMLHKLRRAMVRPGRDRLQGVVEVDEAYWGGEEKNVRGRQTYEKALIAVAAEADGQRIGRIRLRHIADTSRKTLHGFIADVIAPGSTVQTDGLQSYRELQGYVHERQVQSRQPKDADHLLPRVHLVISLFKRWLLGTHQGAIATDYLQDYLDEFTFRFNRRNSASRGKLFYRLVQQAVKVSPSTFDSITAPNP